MEPFFIIIHYWIWKQFSRFVYFASNYLLDVFCHQRKETEWKREREKAKATSENEIEWVEIERRNYSILKYSANEWKHVLSHRTNIDRSANKEIETETNYEIINGPKLQTKSGDLLPEYYNMHVWMEDLFVTISFIYDAFVRFNIPNFSIRIMAVVLAFPLTHPPTTKYKLCHSQLIDLKKNRNQFEPNQTKSSYIL